MTHQKYLIEDKNGQMKIYTLIVRELLHRKLVFISAVTASAVAVTTLIASLAALQAHDLCTASILDAKEKETAKRMAILEDEMRKTMLKLSFNLVILPEGQDLKEWYSDESTPRYMPEEYVTRLTTSRLMVIQHILPILQAKIKWQEKNRTIILIGTRGEVPGVSKTEKKPLLDPVPAGTIVLGYELHKTMGLKPGDKVTLLGKIFTVHKCHEERGNKDDITAWINLAEAQELLQKPGLINAILALECVCTKESLPIIRQRIAKLLPGTQVIERGTEALARAEARAKAHIEAQNILNLEKINRTRQREEIEFIASAFVTGSILGCAIWLFLIALWNFRDRRTEIGILRTSGYRTSHILQLFIGKFTITGLIGCSIGFYAGIFLAPVIIRLTTHECTVSLEPWLLVSPVMLPLIIISTCILSVISTLIPALLVATEDPSNILRNEG